MLRFMAGLQTQCRICERAVVEAIVYGTKNLRKRVNLNSKCCNCGVYVSSIGHEGENVA